MSTTAISSASTATGTFAEASGGAELDREAFLLLLTTQFQYQDPLNPMEDKEFIAQLAQFSALEQQMNTNATMESMLAVQMQEQTISAVSYIGNSVSARGYGVSLDEAGDASLLQFGIEEPMSEGYVNIFDAAGTLVSTIPLGAFSAGWHDFTWDGSTNTGSPASPGVYTAYVAAFGEDGESISTDTNVSGVVTGVQYYEDGSVLTLSDGRQVALSYVREVQAPTNSGDTDTSEEDEDSSITDIIEDLFTDDTESAASTTDTASTDTTATDSTIIDQAADTLVDTANAATGAVSDAVDTGVQQAAETVQSVAATVTDTTTQPIQQQSGIASALESALQLF